MDINFLRGLATVIVMGAFLGICWWAYVYRSKDSFNQAANLPFADESDEQSNDLDTNKPNASNLNNGEHQ